MTLIETSTIPNKMLSLCPHFLRYIPRSGPGAAGMGTIAMRHPPGHLFAIIYKVIRGY